MSEPGRPDHKHQRVATIIINRDQPQMTNAVVEQVLKMGAGLHNTIYVVEAGSSQAGQSQFATHWFRDPSYRGRYYAFNRGLDLVLAENCFDYVWFVVNDISFPEDQDVLRKLWEISEREPRMAIIGPGEPESDDYQGCKPQEGREWHKASNVHGLAWLMKIQAIKEVGYAARHFHYSWGASTELSYKLYRAGWFMAYADTAFLYHRGGSTYGKVVKVSRHEYLRRARNYARKYFEKTYGNNWDEEFSKALPDDVEINMYPIQRKVWEKTLRAEPRFPWIRRWGSRVKQFLGLSRR